MNWTVGGGGWAGNPTLVIKPTGAAWWLQPREPSISQLHAVTLTEYLKKIVIF